MRFIIMHKTEPRWEAGALPDAELIARVGRMIGALSRAAAFETGEGLGPSSKGVRLRFKRGEREIVPGPFAGEHEQPAAFSIVRTRTLDEAIEWATTQAGALGDEVELDIRPVNEPWDIGIAQKPPGLETQRYMVLRKATASASAGTPSKEQRAALSRLIDDTTRSGVHIATETMRPGGRGRRYLNASNGISAFDGPFVESKELLGGYVIVSARSMDDADRWAREYIAAVNAREVDLLELE